MFRDARKYIVEPGEGVYFYQLAGGHETAQNRRGASAAVAAKKRPVVAAHGPAAQGALGSVVVDGQIRMVAVTRQRDPVLQNIVDRLPGFAFRKQFLASLLQIGVQL